MTDYSHLLPVPSHGEHLVVGGDVALRFRATGGVIIDTTERREPGSWSVALVGRDDTTDLVVDLDTLAEDLAEGGALSPLIDRVLAGISADAGGDELTEDAEDALEEIEELAGVSYENRYVSGAIAVSAVSDLWGENTCTDRARKEYYYQHFGIENGMSEGRISQATEDFMREKGIVVTVTADEIRQQFRDLAGA